MKVFILTEGGRNIGFGHLTRCISLYQAFGERKIRPELIVNSDKTVRDLLKNKQHQIFDWLKEKKKLFNIIRNAAIVIVDSYSADFNFYKKISETTKIPVYIDDTRRLDYPDGIVINGMIYADELAYQKTEDSSYLLGGQYAILRKEFWGAPKRDIRRKMESIMVTFGGDDGRDMTSKILAFLNDAYPSLTKNIIIGKAFQNKQKIENLKGTKINFIYNPDAGKMKKIMMKTNIAISAGGQTLHELARMGVPTIGICVAENQRMNLESWQKIGFLEYIGLYYEKHLFDRLKRAISNLFSTVEREKRSKKGMFYMDGKGAKRIINRLFKKI